jgi:glycosyltransferase involved in cell wall biosynthesis
VNILFVHQNFPGQFPHLAPALEQRGHRVVALTDQRNRRASPIAEVYRYPSPRLELDTRQCRLGKTYTEMSERGLMAARAARALRDRHGLVPDVIIGNIGWGETLYLRDIWPATRQIAYGEFYYAGRGLDTDFDPEFAGNGPDNATMTTARQAHLAHAMAQADAALAPTRFQADTFPPCFRDRITVIHDGVDTGALCPDPKATVTLPDGTRLMAGDEVLTFANRNLEPYRGYHVFMRALPEVMAARPQARVVLVGGDGVSYGRRLPEGQSWKQRFLAEVAESIDPARVHFTGFLPRDDFTALMQVSRVHAYLSYPFVLSWSLLEAMAAGAHVVASRTPPVEEVVVHGETGHLVDFFDISGWSAALIEGLADPRAHDPLRAAARAHVVRRYDLRSVCLPRLLEFVESQGAAGTNSAP